MSRKKKMSLEEHFEQIEQIIDAMEQENVTLDASFDLYKKGLMEIQAANAMLETMEQAMLKLNEEDELEEFE